MSALTPALPLAEPWPEFPYPRVELIESDGIPLETLWHGLQINLLVDVVTRLYHPRHDFFVGGNMFLYFSEEQARNRDFRGPDFFYVNGVPRHKERRWWAIWEEGGRYPDLIVELSSPSTSQLDRTVKKDLYETTFRTPEYFCYDPDAKALEGWRMKNGHYQEIVPNERGWLWSEQLGSWLGTWEGEHLGQSMTWLRLFDEHRALRPTFRESAEAEVARLRERLAKLEKNGENSS